MKHLPPTIRRTDLEALIGHFTWIEEKKQVRIVLVEPQPIDTAALVWLFEKRYRLKDEGEVITLIPRV